MLAPPPAYAIVQRLVAAWEALNADAVAACVADDAVWHNIPYPPIAGREAIRAAARAFLGDMATCRFEIRFSGEVSPGVVMNERVDIFHRRDGRELRFPVAGVFEVHDGLITTWRDYFDGAIMAGA